MVYNPTYLFGVPDLIESAYQVFTADFAQINRWIGNLNAAPKPVEDIFVSIADGIDSVRAASLPTTRQHSIIYNSLLNNGRKVAAVTHSQGNLFVNEAYLGIHGALKDGIGIVAVGSPDDVVADHSENHRFENTTGFRDPGKDIYNINLEEDTFMRTVGLLHLELDHWNFDNYVGTDRAPSGTNLGHNFITAYMDTSANNNRTAAQVIVDETLARFDKTKSAKCRTPKLTIPNGPNTGNSWVVDNGSGLSVAPAITATPVWDSRLISLLDWKGAYEDGVATKSISFHGPASRINGRKGYGNTIYRDGRPFYVFSLQEEQSYILGAALTEDEQGDEWVIAVTTNDKDINADSGSTIASGNNTNAVFKRRVKKVQGLTVIDNNPSINPNPDPKKMNEPYWEKIGEFYFEDDSYRYAPWHFNGDGREAQTLRIEQESLIFDYSICQETEDCNYTDLETHDVSVLNRYKLKIAPDLSSAWLQDLGYETGNQAVLAVDYLDDQELILRSRNSREFGVEPHLIPPDEAVWLELNGESLVGADILTCRHKTFYACLPYRDTAFSPNWSGLVGTRLGRVDDDGPVRETNIHIHHMDLRTRTFEFSKFTVDIGNNGENLGGAYLSNFSNADYYFSHNGGDPQLMASINFAESDFATLGKGYAASYYGRAGGLVNAQVRNRLTPPIRGQYLAGITSPLVAPQPVYSGRVVEPDGHLLISSRFAKGETFNFYSRTNLEQLTGAVLTGETVLPLLLN